MVVSWTNHILLADHIEGNVRGVSEHHFGTNGTFIKTNGTIIKKNNADLGGSIVLNNAPLLET